MKKGLLIIVLLSARCAGDPDVPVNTTLWRLENGWQSPPAGMRQDVRVARGTMIAFRASGEYVEVHCSLIEQPDETVLIQSGRPCVSAVGRWEREGETVVVHREQATARALCTQPQLTFRITGNSVTGDVTGAGAGSYSPVTRFVAPEFETHVNAAKRSDVRCGT